MTRLRDLLGIELRPFNRFVDYKVAGHTIAEFHPHGPSTCFDYESDGTFQHRSDFEEWFAETLIREFAAVLPVIIGAGDAIVYQPAVYLPFYMHYDLPHDEEVDCE